MKSLVLLVATCTCLVQCLPPPHPDVLAVKREEELLHPLLKSPVLRNPHLLKILPLTSLLHEGENLVFEREANKVSREEIYKILTHAGFISRSAFSSLDHEQFPDFSIVLPEEHISLLDSFPSHDALQYL